TLSRKFERHRIELQVGGLSKTYATKALTALSFTEFRDDLDHFTELLKQEGFQPLITPNPSSSSAQL
ncbi:MAG: hypothetical protein ABW174_13950, partial [Flavitalea sp.]